MFMHVKLLNSCPKILTYKIPENWPLENLQGSIVKVPLQNRIEMGLVQEVFEKPANTVNFAIKKAHSLEVMPKDRFYGAYIKQLSDYYAIEEIYFYKRIRHFLQEKEQESSYVTQTEDLNIQQVTLTEEQQTAVNSIKPHIQKPIYFPVLLHGVTGSGKTEVYKQLIIETILGQNKSTVLNLPEVSLAVQFSNILKKQLPNSIKIFGFHSATSITEKRSLWQTLLAGQPMVIIGVHLPQLLPIPNLGLIIVDEEHEVGFQEKKHPKINSKEAAILRASINKIPIILGSATPSLTSLYNIEKRNWHLVELKKRYAGNFPQISIVRLTEITQNRKNFWISAQLERAIRQRLEKKEQVIIFLNRRGYSFFIQCKKCGFIPSCIHCSVSLTLHNNQQLYCHYCNYTINEPNSCSDCKTDKSEFLKKGIGTQQIVTILQKIFTNARIARADLDTTINKKKWQQIVADFENGLLDILVGTQTITKGYHFPRVTLVGILWADINLSLPIYNASEVTLQQLIQVAGRAGRQSHESQVIIQTMIDHPIYRYLEEKDYAKFYSYEINNRSQVIYPPCTRLAEIELKHTDENAVVRDSEALAEELIQYVIEDGLKTLILGPAQPPVHMIKKIHLRKIYLKSDSIKELLKIYQSIDKSKYTSNIFFTPNPLN